MTVTMAKPSTGSDEPAGDAAAGAYARAGVDLGARTEFVERLKKITGTGRHPNVLAGVGGFGALYRLAGYRDPVLASSVDGVGTKIRIAELMGRFDTVGQDLVNHCVNDILTTGAEPLFFLDYVGSSQLAPDRKLEVIGGLKAACDAHECAFIGGETADMPDVYQPGDFDLVGFIVGAVERDAIIDGAKMIREGDGLIGLPVTGLHTNGYSLVRKIFGIGVGGDPADDRAKLDEWHEDLGLSLGDALLAVHTSYYFDLKPLLPRIHGFAHITGGGLIDNVPRVLPDGLAARFDAGSWDVPAIFRLIQREGRVADADMYHTFNMGIGGVLAVDPAEANAVAGQIDDARIVGTIVRQSDERRVIIE
jgi:phosphoribosylformylglycinamidine cyclo-ligase